MSRSASPTEFALILGAEAAYLHSPTNPSVNPRHISNRIRKKAGLEIKRIDNDTLLIKTIPVSQQSDISSIDQLLFASEASRKFLANYKNSEESQ